MKESERTMRPMMHAVLLCSLTAALAPAAPVTAQVDEPAMVPTEFMRAFLTLPWLPDGGQPELMVGRLPSALTDHVRVPGGVRVIGSVVAGRFTINALVVPGAEDRVVEQFSMELARDGWREFDQSFESVGFESYRADRAPLFCQGDSLSLTLATDARAGDSTRVHLMLFTGRDDVPCAMRSIEASRRYRQADVPVLKLKLPAGVRALGSGTGGGEDNWHAEVRLRTDQGVDALLQHYAASMEAQGWRLLESVERGTFAVASLERRVPGERAWLGILTVGATGAEMRLATVRLIRLD